MTVWLAVQCPDCHFAVVMDYELRVIVEKVSSEQISLLAKIQNAVLAEQSALIDSGHTACPKCGQKLKKYGLPTQLDHP